MSEPKIIKFGVITEQNNGELLIENFDIDADGGNDPMQITTLTAIRNRFNDELAWYDTTNVKFEQPEDK